MRVFYNAEVKQEEMYLTLFGEKDYLLNGDQAENRFTSVVWFHVMSCIFSLSSFLAEVVQELF